MFLMDWVRMHGEMALLYAEDLRYFIRPRRQRFTKVRYRRISDINSTDADAWFRATPHQLRMLYVHWRIPDTFRNPVSGHMFTGKECFLIFLYHLIKGVTFTKMARQPFGGDPRYAFLFDV